MDLQVGYATHKGPVRPKNQDAIGVIKPQTGLFRRKSPPLFVVADGMGGHLGGEVASQIAVEAARFTYLGNQKLSHRTVIEDSILAANHSIYSRALASPELNGMGTTIVAGIPMPDQVTIGNVGDSRAYLITSEEILLLTKDHSLVEEQVRAGFLSSDEANQARGRNMLTRAVGRRVQLEVDLYEAPWEADDRLLLCTDGLWGVVTDEEISEVVRSDTAQAACDMLIKLAVEARTKDNISLILARHMG